MRIIVLMVSLLIVALLLARQLGLGSPSHAGHPAPVVDNGGAALPKVPSKPQDLRSFDKQINAFVKHAANSQANSIDQQAK